MKQLQKEFIGKGQVKGFEFTQIKRTKNAYIYQVSSNGRTWYEVFKHKENDRFNCVSYPSNKAFGIWAWSCNSYNRAIDKMEEIENSLV